MAEQNKTTTRLNTIEDRPADDSTEVAKLKAENKRLKAELAAAKSDSPNTRPEPTEPSYGISEGQRADLEEHGRTVSPFTGALQVGDGQGQPREVDTEEFQKAERPE